MASPKLIPYGDSALLASDEADVFAAYLAQRGVATAVELLTDAGGNPLTPSHPLLARNPGLAVNRYAPAIRFEDLEGGLLVMDDLVLATLPDVRTQTAVDKPAPTGNEAADLAALRALIPAGDMAPIAAVPLAIAPAKGNK